MRQRTLAGSAFNIETTADENGIKVLMMPGGQTIFVKPQNGVMFFSKTPGMFESHLPQATRAAMRKAGTSSGASLLSGFSMLSGQLTSRGQQLQAFEAGPTLVLLENSDAHSKFEIDLERDDLVGDEDEIELSFHGSKDGEPQTAGAKFRLTLTMKQETGISVIVWPCRADRAGWAVPVTMVGGLTPGWPRAC